MGGVGKGMKWSRWERGKEEGNDRIEVQEGRVTVSHLAWNVHINARSGKELFHACSMTSTCCKV